MDHINVRHQTGWLYYFLVKYHEKLLILIHISIGIILSQKWYCLESKKFKNSSITKYNVNYPRLINHSKINSNKTT